MSISGKINSIGVEDLVDKHMKNTKFGRKSGLIVGGIVGVAALADAVLEEAKRSRARTQEKIAKNQEILKEKKRVKQGGGDESRQVAYYDMMQFNNYLQDLHKNRSGSSNTYGGKRY